MISPIQLQRLYLKSVYGKQCNSQTFKMFESYLRNQGLEDRGEQIIDATLAPV